MFLLSAIPFFHINAFSQGSYPTDPKEAVLATGDLNHFLMALIELETNEDTVSVLQEMYFDKASPGLQEYIRRFELDGLAGAFAQKVTVMKPRTSSKPSFASRDAFRVIEKVAT
ncbi:MAG: hypothetical protein J5I98_14980 [Phaeodactylibacter sp.]|nr:hypothetical protein [Phaeodactylibacter sp.]